MDEKDYPTELVSLDFFGGRQVAAGDKASVEIVSVDEGHAQIRCDKAKSNGKNAKPDAGKAIAGRYREKMETPE